MTTTPLSLPRRSTTSPLLDAPRTGPRFMLFETHATGHRPQYLHQLASYWVEQRLTGQLVIVAPPTLQSHHPAIASYFDEHAQSGLRLVPLEHPVYQPANSGILELARANLSQGRALQHHIRRLRPARCAVMHFDHLQLPLALSLRFDFPVEIAGIYFRPSFHYHSFTCDSTDTPGFATRLRKRAILRWALSNPHFKHLLSLDPYAVPFIERLTTSTTVAAIPDGIRLAPPTATRDQTRHRLGVQPGRRVLLLFGVIGSRKGIFQVVEALRRTRAPHLAALSLVVAGPLADQERSRIVSELHELESSTPLQVIVDDRYIPDAEVQDLIRGTDLALVTYQRHVGSSNVLMRVAAEETPVLGSDFGLVGQYIRNNRLGLAVDTTRPDAIAQGIARYCAAPEDIPFDASRARSFAEGHTADRFAATLFQHLGIPGQVGG